MAMAVASKQSGLFQPCNLVANLGEVAACGTYLCLLSSAPGISILKHYACMPIRCGTEQDLTYW